MHARIYRHITAARLHKCTTILSQWPRRNVSEGALINMRRHHYPALVAKTERVKPASHIKNKSLFFRRVQINGVFPPGCQVGTGNECVVLVQDVR